MRHARGTTARRWTAGAALVLAAGLCAFNLAASAGVSISIHPEVSFVELDEEFTVYIWVDSAGSDFSAYEALIRYDPFALQVISVQEESLMVELCYDTYFPDPVFGDSTILIEHVALCGGLTLTGPGALSSITFQALAEVASLISFDRVNCSRGGFLVEDVEGHPGWVLAGEAQDLAAAGHRLRVAPALEIAPSLVPHSACLTFTLSRPGRIELHAVDASGRTLERIASAWYPRGRHQLRWVPSRGSTIAYLRLLSAGGAASQRVILLD
jgi:hypothetical protein